MRTFIFVDEFNGAEWSRAPLWQPFWRIGDEVLSVRRLRLWSRRVNLTLMGANGTFGLNLNRDPPQPQRINTLPLWLWWKNKQKNKTHLLMKNEILMEQQLRLVFKKESLESCIVIVTEESEVDWGKSFLSFFINKQFIMWHTSTIHNHKYLLHENTGNHANITLYFICLKGRFPPLYYTSHHCTAPDPLEKTPPAPRQPPSK